MCSISIDSSWDLYNMAADTLQSQALGQANFSFPFSFVGSDIMPSLRSLAGLAVGLLTSSYVSGGTPKTCANSDSTPLSCHSSTAASCCYISPGGLLLQTQFWDTAPATGPVDSWTVHGLWYVDLDIGSKHSC